jgi:hypothetical protein
MKDNELYGMDCDKYAAMYAAVLLRNPQRRITDFIERECGLMYKRLDLYKRQEVVRSIKDLTEEVLCASGYRREIVAGILCNNQ